MVVEHPFRDMETYIDVVKFLALALYEYSQITPIRRLASQIGVCFVMMVAIHVACVSGRRDVPLGHRVGCHTGQNRGGAGMQTPLSCRFDRAWWFCFRQSFQALPGRSALPANIRFDFICPCLQPCIRVLCCKSPSRDTRTHRQSESLILTGLVGQDGQNELAGRVGKRPDRVEL